MRPRITLKQEAEVVRLYKSKNHTIKEIMSITGVRSEQTIYRILDDSEIPRKTRLKTYAKMVICVEEDVYKILKEQISPSLYVNEAVRKYAKKPPRTSRLSGETK